MTQVFFISKLQATGEIQVPRWALEILKAANVNYYKVVITPILPMPEETE